MKGYIIENIQNCCDDFQQLLLLDKYITKKMYDSFMEKYQDTFRLISKNYVEKNSSLYNKIMSIANSGYQIIEKRNQKYIEDKLKLYKSYFDTMFNNIDEQIMLSDEQRRAILMDEDYSLIIAGAGSGKTTTIAAKVKYLVDKCNVKPQEIVLIAYSDKAMQELSQRVNGDFGLDVPVLTFHKFGMEFVKKIFDKPVQLVSNNTIYEMIVDYIIKEIFSNKDKLKIFINSFKDYVIFKDDVYQYNNYNDYYKDYVDKKYSELNNNKEEIINYIQPKIMNRLKNNRSITGEYYKSSGETMVANYLYVNGIDYEYKKAILNRDNKQDFYYPDFTIKSGNKKTYIEYYGLTSLRSDGSYTTDDIKLYKNLINKKHLFHKKYNNDLIELYSHSDNGKKYLDILKDELKKRDVSFNSKSLREIYYELLNTSKEYPFINFINLEISFITRFKEKGYRDEDFDLLIDHEYNDSIRKQLLFTRELYRYYQDRLHHEYKVDFNDVINFAYRGMEKVKHTNKKLNYKYLIIDEYQDISKQKYNFAKKVSDVFNSKIVASGDDWQAIYSFNGSDAELFTRFYQLMGYADIARITQSYRNSQELVDVAGDFVGKNASVFSKTLVSSKHLDNPVEIYYYDETISLSRVKILENIIQDIYNHNAKSKILLLGRNISDINLYINSKEFRRSNDDKIICKNVPNAEIDFLTVSGAKGLEYDQVILLNTENSKNGFPGQIEEEPLLKVLDNTKKELIEYPEERRLFYVALTRTRNKLYILCPYEPVQDRSIFVKEISKNKNVIEKENV